MPLRFHLQRGERKTQMVLRVTSSPALLLQKDQVGRKVIKQFCNPSLGEITLCLTYRRIHPFPPFEEGSMPSKNCVSETSVPEIECKHDGLIDSKFHR